MTEVLKAINDLTHFAGKPHCKKEFAEAVEKLKQLGGYKQRYEKADEALMLAAHALGHYNTLNPDDGTARKAFEKIYDIMEWGGFSIEQLIESIEIILVEGES